MKKFFNIFTLLMILIGLTACANPFDPSLGGSNAYKDGCITIQLEDVEGANRCSIYRKNTTTQESINIDVNDYQNNKTRTVTDYFTNPGEEYSYYIKYYKANDNGQWQQVKNEEKVFTSKLGVGELKLESYTKGTYNQDTGILSFSQEPLLNPTIENFIQHTTDCKKYINFNYKDKKTNNWVLGSTITKDSLKFNLPSLFDDWRDQYYDKPLTIDYCNFQVSLESVTFQKQLSNAEISQIFVDELIVKDNRIPLSYSYSAEGTVINIPQIDNVERISINRYTKDEYGNYNNSLYIESYKNIKQITDYFIESGKDYYYQVELRDDNWKILQKSKKTLIKGKSGVGELRSIVTPVESYDSTTGIMTFSVLPELNSQTKNLVSQPSKGNENNYSNFYISYSYRKPGNWRSISPEIIEKTDMSAAINRDYMFNQELTFNNIGINIRIDDIFYNADSEYDITDKKIIVPDTRCEITTKQTDKGIEITLPSVKPADADYVTIGRKSVNHPTNNDMAEWYINIHDLNTSAVTDYFVTKGEKYEYKAFYRKRNNQGYHYVVKESKPSEIEVTNSQLNGFLNPNTKVSYDETSGIMTITPKPNLNINIPDLKVNLYLNYEIGNTDRYMDCKVIDGQIDISKSFYSKENIDTSSELRLNQLYLEASINNISYYQHIYRDELLKIVPSLKNYETIRNIPDTREKAIVNEHSDGIEIQLRDIPNNCQKIRIDRYDVSRDIKEEQYIQINSLQNRKSIIDYFVKPNNQYKYKIVYRSQDWDVLKETSYSDSISTNKGMGELLFTNTPNVTYDSSSTVMKFNGGFDFSNQLEELDKKGIKHNDYSVMVFYSTFDNQRTIGGWASLKNNIGYINWTSALTDNERNEKYFNKDLNLSKLQVRLWVDNSDVYEHTIIREAVLTKMPSIPTTINVQDNRVPLEAKPNEKGIEIIIPSSILQNQNIGEIRVERYGDGFSDNNYLSVRKENNTFDKSSIDYFVEPGKTYEYALRIYDGKSWFNATKKSNPVTANKGCGELRLESTITSANFDQSTGKQTIIPAQTYTNQKEQLKELSGDQKCDISMALNYSTRDIGQGNWIFDIDHDGIIDWNDISNNKNEYLDFCVVIVRAYVKNTRYEAWMYVNSDPRLKGMVNNVPKTIFIKG